MSEIKLWLAAENERLEAELAQTKRNIIHVEDCWANVLSALDDSQAELRAANAKIAGFESLTRRPWLAPEWYTEFLLNPESATPKPTDNSGKE